MTGTNRWFKLSTTFYMDDKILQVGYQAELLFLRILAFVSAAQTNGRVTAAQLRFCGRGLRNIRSSTAELLQVNLIHAVVDPQSNDTYYAVSAHDKWTADAPPESKKPAQPAKKAAPASMDEPRAPAPARAYAEKERVEREPFRSPSGSDRNGSARAAPRSAEGAAQPAPDVDGAVDGDRVSFDDPRAAARRLAEEGRQRNKMSSGRNAPLRQSEWQKRQEQPSRHSANMAAMEELFGGAE